MFLESEAYLMEQVRRQRLAEMNGKVWDVETAYGRSRLYPITTRLSELYNKTPRMRIRVWFERRESPIPTPAKA